MKWMSVIRFIQVINWHVTIHPIPTRWLRMKIIRLYFKFTKWRLDTVKRLKAEVTAQKEGV
jgi:hypothetical protein